ncbi:MAG: hypothetical protein WCG25_04235 [bacterium]
MKLVSIVPLLFSLAILFAIVQLYVVNCHPTTIFPSPCTAIALTI